MIDPGREIRQEIIGATLAMPTVSVARSAFTGALWGGGSVAASQFLATGGITAAGVAAGAAAGAAISGVATAALALIPIWEKLSRVSLALVDSLAQIHPYYRALSGVAKVQERIQGIQWGEAVRPLMEKWFNWSMEFRQSWVELKIMFYQAIQPLLKRLLDAIIQLTPAILSIVGYFVGLIEALSNVAEVIMKLASRTSVLGMWGEIYKTLRSKIETQETSPEEEATRAGVAWGKVVGYSATGLIGWILGLRELFSRGQSSGQGSLASFARGALAEGSSFGQGAMARGAAGTPSLTQTIGGATANVTVQVQDHTELTRAFEEAWSKIRRTLMEREAEMVISSMRLRETLL